VLKRDVRHQPTWCNWCRQTDRHSFNSLFSGQPGWASTYSRQSSLRLPYPDNFVRGCLVGHFIGYPWV